jgi:hypothetical protein
VSYRDAVADYEHYISSKAVAYSDKGTGHLLAEMVDHQEEVTRVIHPRA